MNFFGTDRIWVLDGGMGTMLMEKGISVDGPPEILNVENPKVIEEVHRAYIDAGAEIIETNTFGSNRIKLSHYSLEDMVFELTYRGVEIAKRASAGKALVALSVGPTGRFVEPVGDISFDEMLGVFKEQISAGAKAGADMIIVETMSDVREAKAAVVAAREVCDLPLIVSMTYQDDGRTLLGTPPEVAASIFEAFGVDAVGANCSLGPDKFVDIVGRMASVTRIPIIVYANAGLPIVKDGRTYYPEPPQVFGEYALKFVEAGANIIGGCCGTTPEHIKAIRRVVAHLKPVVRTPLDGLKVTSRTRLVIVGGDRPTVIVGERINPTGRKKLQDALKNMDFSIIRNEAKAQVDEGADILDVNVGVAGIDEAQVMEKAVRTVMDSVDVPLMIDSKNPEAIESALKLSDGRSIVNSCSAETKDIERILPLVKKYGSNVLVLAVDDEGIKYSAEDRLRVVERIVNACRDFGVSTDRIVVDVLNLSVSAVQEACVETLRAVRLVGEKLRLPAILGVSNVSFGLPGRSYVNASFISMAIFEGLSAGIVNPGDDRVMKAIFSSDVLVGRDAGASRFIGVFHTADGRVVTDYAGLGGVLKSIFEMVIDGDRESIVDATLKALEKYAPMEIADRVLIPALDVVGKKFESGQIFLPQMLRSARAVQASFAILRERMKKGTDSSGRAGKVIMATVHGDVHEIGKNIVITMLENSGFEVIDLGTNVPPERIVETAKRETPDVIGLSALMTTTLPSMEETVKALRNAGVNIPVVVGGAVVTPEYAKSIGAIYGDNAQEAVRIVRKIIEKEVNR